MPIARKQAEVEAAKRERTRLELGRSDFVTAQRSTEPKLKRTAW